MEDIVHDGAIEDSLPLDFSNNKKKKKKKLNLCELLAKIENEETNQADKVNGCLDLENGKKNKEGAFNLHEPDEVLPDATGKMNGDTTEGLADERVIEESLCLDFSNMKKRKKKKVNIFGPPGEIERRERNRGDTENDHLDLENFGEKKENSSPDETDKMKGDSTEGLGNDSLPLEFSLKMKKKKKKKLNLCELVAKNEKEETNQADKVNGYLDVEKGKENKKRAFNLHESDEVLPDATGKMNGDTTEGLADERVIKDSLSPQFLKLGKRTKKNLMIMLKLFELVAEIEKGAKKQADKEKDYLDLENFGKKKKNRKKSCNLHELEVLPDAPGKLKGGKTEGLPNDGEIKKKKTEKKTKKFNFDLLWAEIEKERKKQAYKENAMDYIHKWLSSDQDYAADRKLISKGWHYQHSKMIGSPKPEKVQTTKKKSKNIVLLSYKTLEEGQELEQSNYQFSKMIGSPKAQKIRTKKKSKNIVLMSNKTLEDGHQQNEDHGISENFQDLKPPQWLEDVETPFKWAGALNKKKFKFSGHNKLCDYEGHGSFYGFEKFAILLLIIYKRTIDLKKTKKYPSGDEMKFGKPEITQGEDNEKDKEDTGYYYKLEEAFGKCEETVEEMALNGDVIYNRIGLVFHHVLQATKAYVEFFKGEYEESNKLARSIRNVEEMSQQCKAGIEGLKVRFMMSTYDDYEVLLPLLYKAIELDPQFGYWYYLTGKVKRRLRRRDTAVNIEQEELEYFKQAVELERNPKFLVFLAQACQEMAFLMCSEGLEPRSTIHDLLNKSTNLFSECLTLKNDSASISRRVGNGMTKMKEALIDKAVAKETLLKASELSSMNKPHHALGKYYYFHERDDEKALEYFEKDGPNFYGSSEIIRLKLIRDPDYDPHDDLLAWLSANKGNKQKQQSLYCDCGWYYLMYKNDLRESVKYFWKVLKRDFKSPIVMNYKSYAFLIFEPINMVEVLVNEILLFNERIESLPVEDKKKKRKIKPENVLMNRFLIVALRVFPDLNNIIPKPDLLDKLKKSVEHRIASLRKIRYEAQNSKHNRITEQCVNLRNREPFRQEEVDGKYKRATTQLSRRPEKPLSWRNNPTNDGEPENDRGAFREQEVYDRYNRATAQLCRRPEEPVSWRNNRANDEELGNYREPSRQQEGDGRCSLATTRLNRRPEEPVSWRNNRANDEELGNYREPSRQQEGDGRCNLATTRLNRRPEESVSWRNNRTKDEELGNYREPSRQQESDGRCNLASTRLNRRPEESVSWRNNRTKDGELGNYREPSRQQEDDVKCNLATTRLNKRPEESVSWRNNRTKDGELGNYRERSRQQEGDGRFNLATTRRNRRPEESVSWRNNHANDVEPGNDRELSRQQERE